jgi:hypothetical protein
MEEKFFYRYIERTNKHLFSGLQVWGETTLFFLFPTLTII